MAACTFAIWACCGATMSAGAERFSRSTLRLCGGIMRLTAFLTLACAFTAFAWDANEDLLSAARAGDLAAAKAAIEKGAAVESKTPYGQTPLYLAAMNGHADVVEFLAGKGARTDVQDTFYKASILDFVLQRKHYDVAKTLISKGT